MNIDKLLNLYWSDHPKAIIIVRESSDKWLIGTRRGTVTICNDSKANVIRIALTYGNEVILVEQQGENGYEEPDVSQIWSDETTGY